MSLPSSSIAHVKVLNHLAQSATKKGVYADFTRKTETWRVEHGHFLQQSHCDMVFLACSCCSRSSGDALMSLFSNDTCQALATCSKKHDFALKGFVLLDN